MADKVETPTIRKSLCERILLEIWWVVLGPRIAIKTFQVTKPSSLEGRSMKYNSFRNDCPNMQHNAGDTCALF